jgi:hypothetical protein
LAIDKLSADRRRAIDDYHAQLGYPPPRESP